MMALEITKICRTCLALEGALLSIYDNKGSSGGNGCVADMLGDLTSIPPKLYDGMPDRVCLACISEINRCYSFKIKCDNSDRTLRQLLNLTEVEVQQEEEKKSNTEGNTMKQSPDEKKKPQKRKADTSVRILNQEFEEVPVSEPNFIDTEELEGSYFVVGSEEDEQEKGDEPAQESQGDEEYEEILHKFVSQPEEYEEEEANNKTKTDFKPATKPKKEELKCEMCPMTFVHPRNLKKHIQRHHTFEQEEQQPVSVKDDDEGEQESPQSTEDYEMKFQVVDESEDVSVIRDPQLLKELVQMQMHKHRCPRCGAGFAQQKSLNIHIKQNKCTEKQYICNKCTKVFISADNLRAHIRTHKEEFNCKACGQSFTKKEDLIQHKADVHDVNVKNQCQICKKVFTMLSTLKDHLRIHSGERPFLCSICGKGFSQNANLKQHVMRHNKTKPFKCEECSRSFVSKGELSSHLRSHTGDHPFVCDICKTAFTTSSSLVKHKRIHTGERPYACDFCPMRFTALNTLKNHRRTHTGEKPYKCKYCQRGFAQKSDCAIHMRTHTGERRYVCQVCGSAFQQSGTLRTHMKTHRSLKEDASQSQEEAEQSPSVVGVGDEDEVDEVDEEQQQEHLGEKKPTLMDVGVELGEEDLLHFAIEECSSENNDFSGE